MTPAQYPNMTKWARNEEIVEEDGSVSSCRLEELAFHHINPLLWGAGVNWIPPQETPEDFADENEVFQWAIEAYKEALNDA